MADFDPDAFLSAPAPQGGSFDPDAFLKPGQGNPVDEHNAALPKQQQQEIAQQSRISSAPVQMLRNIPLSAADFASNLVQPIIHPIDTYHNIKNLGQGALEKTGLISGDEHKKYADAFAEYFKNRYGGLENAKKSLVDDPVGVAADLSMILTGGGSAAARLPGMAGKVGEVANAAGRVIDPVSATANTVRAGTNVAGKAASEIIGGLGTQTGGKSIQTAANAGYEGGEAAKAFQDSMRGNIPMEDVVNSARTGLQNIRNERGNAYRNQMTQLSLDNRVLDFGKIDDAFDKVGAIKTFKGQNLSPETAGIRTKLGQTIENWKKLDPNEFHTAEGLDALKQKIGDIRDATDPGTPARVVANQVYGAVRNTIVKEAPEYARIMKGYEEASNQIKEIEKTLSLNPKASVDSSLRKLQSVLRNNVNANYGSRAELADYLTKAGAPHLMEKLAGQSMNSWLPRGLGKLGMQIGAEMGLIGAGTAAAGATGAAAALAAAPLMSPRIVGEGAYYAGRAASPLKHVLPYSKPLMRGAFQAGRTAEEMPEKARGGAISAIRFAKRKRA